MTVPPPSLVGAVRRRAAAGPDDARSWLALADAAASRGIHEEAATYCARATAPARDANSLYRLGTASLLSGNAARAVRAFRRAITLQPAEVFILANAGEAAAFCGALHDAIALHCRALAVRAGGAKSWANLALAWSRLGETDPALRCGRRAVALDPSLAAAHINVGLAAQGLRQRTTAEAHFRRALAIDRSSAEAGFALATMRLAAGDFETGFALYEHRFRLSEMRDALNGWVMPLWDGQIKKGSRLLLWAEQGFGDAIHFVRYAPLLARAGMKVTIACLEPLRRLFRSLDPAIAACGFDTLPAADAHAPLMSLPKLLGTCLADVPANVPYFRTDALAPALLRTAPPPRIGLVWAGRPEYRADRTRSFSPEVFRRLVSALAPVGARLFSLQVGARRSDLRDAPAPILDLGGDFSDFADTAAAIDGLDLLISIDSAVAHLAGALGRPVWVMLAYVPEWRWLEGRSDSPWYPTMRLFRQPRAGDWESVIADLKAALPAAFPSAS